MPAVKTVAIIAALLIGLFLSVPHAALAQGLFEANDLNDVRLSLATPVDIPKLNHCTSSRLRSARKRLVLIIPKLRRR